MRTMKRSLAIVMALLIVMTMLAAAGQATSRKAKILDKKTGKNLTGKTITIFVGQRYTLKGEFTPAISGNPTWKSSKPKVARAASSGAVWAVSPGTAWITLSGGGASAKVKVVVKRNFVDNITKKPTSAKVRKQYYRVDFYLKSAEVLGDGRVVAEYYVGNKSNKRLKAIKNLYIEVTIEDPYYGQPSSGDDYLSCGEFTRVNVNVPAYGVSKIRLTLPKENLTLPAPKLYSIKKWLYAYFNPIEPGQCVNG